MAERKEDLIYFFHPEYEMVRALEDSSSIYFVGRDVAPLFGFENADEAIREHVPPVFRAVVKSELLGPNFEQAVAPIGLKFLAKESPRSDAQTIRAWLTDEAEEVKR